MLIQCPECGKQISDKASSCPNCGYPMINEKKSNICKINDVEYDLSQEISLVQNQQKVLAIKVLREKTNIDLRNAKNIVDLIEFSKLPKEYNCSQEKEYSKQIAAMKPQPVRNVPKCPTCGSTNIKRLFFSGGWNPKQFRCNNCGYEW